jgi:hypothetical protein
LRECNFGRIFRLVDLVMCCESKWVYRGSSFGSGYCMRPLPRSVDWTESEREDGGRLWCGIDTSPLPPSCVESRRNSAASRCVRASRAMRAPTAARPATSAPARKIIGRSKGPRIEGVAKTRQPTARAHSAVTFEAIAVKKLPIAERRVGGNKSDAFLSFACAHFRVNLAGKLTRRPPRRRIFRGRRSKGRSGLQAPDIQRQSQGDHEFCRDRFRNRELRAR